ncbi:MAG TPA: amino acid adenylation domain-containing protein, partial [Puia sp.]|nr:amino acid adenylation domain-containing protein [Puia sp.]
IPGEICIAGDGVARGYLNLPELTDERFVPEPFGGKRKMYRTGDIGKWLPDGNIAFLGRKDQQVKIRGYRIETGEIEVVLRSYPGMETAVVRTIGSDRDGKQLAAWYVHPSQIEVSRLKSFVAKALPVYMIPEHFVAVTEMPLTANGKVDIDRLPHPANEEDRSADFIAPRTATERQLAAIWSEILEKKNIGISDNFFVLGGHSLKVTRLASQIHRVFGANVEFHQLFDEASLESQAALIDRCLPEGGSLRHQGMTISPAPAMQDYPLSSSQRRLWILSQFEESNIAYNIPKVCRCTGKLDRQALEQALLAMIARHEILRTAFRQNKQGEIRQYILLPEHVHFSIGFTDVRGEDNALAAIKQRMETDAGQAFDLTAGCLLKAWLYQTQDNEWYFYYNMHHIISDGWSMGVFLEELLKLYAKYSGHEDALLPGLACQYKDYAVWQQDQLHEGTLGQHRDYWLQQFEGETPVLQLMTDKPRPAMKTYNGAVLSRMLNERSVERLETLCRTSDATLFMGLLAAVNTLLYKYTGQKDIVVGSPIAGRQYADLDDQIGFYLNTLALRTRIGDGDDFLHLLKTVRQLTREAYEHQAWPFDELVKDLKLQRDSSRSALFDVLIDLHRQTDYLPEKLPVIPDLEIAAVEAGNRVISKFDLTFMFIVTDKGLELSVEYNTDLFNGATIQRLISHFEHMVRAVTDDPSRQLSRLDYLSEEEKQQVIVSFNCLPAQYPKADAVPALIAGQVEKCSDDMALSYGDIRTSYRQLEEEALRLAHYINIHHGMGKGSRVGVMMDRSDKMVVALLGIWKAGAAWVPIDPAYPPLRKKFLMEDASVALLITGSAYVFNLDYYQGPVVALDLQLDGMSGDPGWQEPAADPDSLAYIIYTSGSTGMPKGCAITHASLFNYITWANKTYFGEEVKGDFGLFTSPAFDLTITSIFCTLTRGRQLRIYEQDRDLADVLTHTFGASSGIDSIKLTPSHINLLRQLELRSDSIRIAIVGGEALTLDQVMVLKRINPSITIYNEYGPTETTVGCVVHKQEVESPIFIGKPIDNTAIYILDALRQPCGIGIPGELYIGGAGLARGYWGRAELTAEKFVDNPFRSGERMYRTGDWGRWDEEGRISF